MFSIPLRIIILYYIIYYVYNFNLLIYFKWVILFLIISIFTYAIITIKQLLECYGFYFNES